MTKLEEVARALACDGQQDQWEALTLVERSNARADAYRVIEALRNPTEEIVEAGFDNDELGIIWTAAITPDDRKEIWQAMIDSILSEGEK